MAETNRLSIFKDEESNCGNKRPQEPLQQKLGAKPRRPPLAVLADTSDRVSLATLKAKQLTHREPQALQKPNFGRFNGACPLKPNVSAADKENQAIRAASDKVPEQPAKRVESKATGNNENESDRIIKPQDIPMKSPLVHGSPMILSPPTASTSQTKTPSPDADCSAKNVNVSVDRVKSETSDLPLVNEFFTREYSATHYTHLREMELQLRARPGYMARQRDISASMRAVLVDWLVEVNEEYRMSEETLFLAVTLIDRFLSIMAVVRGKLQLLGTSAMFVASKVEEVYPPALTEFAYITDDTYSTTQIIGMESVLLKSLDFSLGSCHSLTFVRLFIVETRASTRVAHMAHYICELSLLNVSILAFLPSEVAAAALALAFHHVNDIFTAWEQQTIQEFSSIDTDQLQEAIEFLHEMLAGARASDQRATFEKYTHTKFSSVSLLPLKQKAPRLLCAS